MTSIWKSLFVCPTRPDDTDYACLATQVLQVYMSRPDIENLLDEAMAQLIGGVPMDIVMKTFEALIARESGADSQGTS
jgi:hypothetical protein